MLLANGQLQYRSTFVRTCGGVAVDRLLLLMSVSVVGWSKNLVRDTTFEEQTRKRKHAHSPFDAASLLNKQRKTETKDKKCKQTRKRKGTDCDLNLGDASYVGGGGTVIGFGSFCVCVYVQLNGAQTTSEIENCFVRLATF